MMSLTLFIYHRRDPQATAGKHRTRSINDNVIPVGHVIIEVPCGKITIVLQSNLSSFISSRRRTVIKVQCRRSHIHFWTADMTIDIPGALSLSHDSWIN